MPGLGHRSYLQFGLKESSYGSFQTPSRKLELISYNIAPQVGVIQDPSLYLAQSRRAMYQGGTLYKGTFVVRLNYEGLEELFRAVFGTYGATVVSSPVNDHTFKEGSLLNSYSFEVSIGDVPANKVFRLLGAKVTNVTIRGTSGVGTDAMLQAEFTVVAKDMTSDNAPTATTSVAAIGSLTISGTSLTRASGSFVSDGVTVGMRIICPNVPANTIVTAVVALTVTMSQAGTNGSGNSASFDALPWPLPVLYHQAVTIDDGTADAASSVRVRSFEVSLENPHAEDRFYLGSVNIDEPLRSDFLVARWRLTQEFTTKTQFEAARSFTVGSPQLLFRHPTDLGGGRFREFELRSNKANLVEFSSPVEGYGVLISTATWEAWYDDTDLSALVARFRNQMAALA